MEIGIIGFGRFGRFAANILRNDFRVYVCDQRKLPNQRGVEVASFDEVALKPVVVLCVPISAIEAVCQRLRPLLKKGQLVLDTCSVKERPLEVMTRILPRSVEVLGTHPLFGPDSARSGVSGFRIVLCQARCRRLGKIRQYLQQLGLEVIKTTAAKHDREMSQSQALFHFLARGVSALHLKIGKLSTPGPARLFNEFSEVQKDSQELFQDLHRMNRYSHRLRRKLLQELIRLDNELSGDTSRPSLGPLRS
jgi:prephenate dehydrogenase